MPMEVIAATPFVRVGIYTHDAGEDHSAAEWWSEDSVVFTTHGSWEIRSERGHGRLSPATILVGQAQREYEFHHPEGLGDRILAVDYLRAVDTSGAFLVPARPRLHRLRRALVRVCAAATVEPDEVDGLAAALLDAARSGDEKAAAPGPRTRAVVDEVRAALEAGYTDADFRVADAVDADAISRTRLIHAFGDALGVTPHRYLVNLRTAHAARLLTQTRTPVIDICFASGFGSMSRFHAAFREAYGLPPARYRARAAGRG